jgi:uncharacterized protein HemX
LPNTFLSPEALLLAFLLASTLAVGACLWLVWMEVRRLAGREQRQRREQEEQLREQYTILNEKMSREMARQRREMEATQQALQSAMSKKLDELQELVDGLRDLGSELQNAASTPAPPPAEAPTMVATRSGFSVIARAANTPKRESSA